jgi:hypothetical protein
MVTFLGQGGQTPRKSRLRHPNHEELRNIRTAIPARVRIMALLVLRLTLVPTTVLVASIVQRRLGPALGGRVVGWPLTTGPFLLLVWLNAGPAVAGRAAAGVVAGQLAVIGFCAAYAHLAALGVRPWLSLAGALTAAAGGTAASALVNSTWLLALLVLGTIGVALLTWPEPDGPPPPTREAKAWELPARMLVSGVLVAGLLGLTHVLGPHLAGVLATMPVILTVLAPATHRRDGRTAATALVRGALASMPASIVFVAVLAYTLVRLGAPVAFGVGLLALLLADQLTSATQRRSRRPQDRRDHELAVMLEA